MLFLEHLHATRLADRRLTRQRRQWRQQQRLHGLCQAYWQECQAKELSYLSKRLETPSGIKKLKKPLTAAIPPEYRASP